MLHEGLREGLVLLFRVSPPMVRRHVFPALTVSRSPFTPQILRREVIFIHIPKAAGTSLKTEIYGRASGGHRSIAEFTAADPVRTKEFFTFSFVRNPWDRMLSAYSWVSQAEGTTASTKEFARRNLRATPTFEEFVHRLVDPDFRDVVMAYTHFRPQTHWICLPDQDVPSLDFLGRYETMQEDLTTLRGRLDPDREAVASSGDGGAHHRRASRHAPYRDSYTPRTRDIVGDLYARDIDVLSYDF